MSEKKPIIIGIAGGSASGKTSISRHIKERFSDQTSILIIRQDDYYKDQSDKPMEERGRVIIIPLTQAKFKQNPIISLTGRFSP